MKENAGFLRSQSEKPALEREWSLGECLLVRSERFAHETGLCLYLYNHQPAWSLCPHNPLQLITKQLFLSGLRCPALVMVSKKKVWVSQAAVIENTPSLGIVVGIQQGYSKPSFLRISLLLPIRKEYFQIPKHEIGPSLEITSYFRIREGADL